MTSAKKRIAKPASATPVLDAVVRKAAAKPVAKPIVSGNGKGTFQYRGLTLKPTFENDDRSRYLEVIMREIAKRTSVFAK